MEPIEFWAIVNKVQTMADGGIRVTLDLPETALMAMAELAACKIGGKVLDVRAVERLPTVTDGNSEAEKGAERGGPEVGSRRVTIRRDKRASG